MKFTDHGYIVVQADSRPLESRGYLVTIAVTDTGSGIDHDDIDRIFGVFEQSSTGVRAGGAGLGLPISRDLARLMGGDLVVRSVVGIGSTFTFSFEVAEAPRTAREQAESGLDLAPRMLVMDDQAANLVTYEGEKLADPGRSVVAELPAVGSLEHALSGVPVVLLEQLRVAAVQARAVRFERLTTELGQHSAFAAEKTLALAQPLRYEELAAVLTAALNDRAP